MYGAQDDLHLSDSNKGYIAAAVFLGMLLGGWVWGSLADRMGRKSCLMLALFTNSVGGVMAAFVGSYHGMLLCRFVAGLGVGGSIPVIFTYFIEFLPTSQRGAFMVYLAWFWMVGAIFTAAIGLGHHPARHVQSVSFIITPFHSWRLFTFICAHALPALRLPPHLVPRVPALPPHSAEGPLTPSASCPTIFAINHPTAVRREWALQAAWCGLCCLTEKSDAWAGRRLQPRRCSRRWSSSSRHKEDSAGRGRRPAAEGQRGGGEGSVRERVGGAGTGYALPADAGTDLTVPSPTADEVAEHPRDKSRVLFTGDSRSCTA